MTNFDPAATTTSDEPLFPSLVRVAKQAVLIHNFTHCNMDSLRDLQHPHPSHRPTAEQYRSKKTVIDELDRELQNIESEVERSQARVTFLQDKKRNLLSYFSPLRCLPNEILREIIDHCRHNGTEPATLAQICGVFRGILLGIPSIWSKIQLKLPASRTDKYSVCNLFD
jgi:hypothetical protein